MIRVWGRNTSSNVQVVMWALAELGVAHERLDWGGAFGGNDDAHYRAMNPNGLIPVLSDGGTVLFESPAILRYLGAQYGDEAFWPTDPGRRAALDMWAEWIKTSVCPELIYKVFWQLIRMPEGRRDETALAAGVAALAELMPRLDARLAEGPWLGGDALTFSDIMAGHVLYRYMTLPFDRVETPNIDTYYARLCERAAYRDHVMVSYESLRNTA